MTTKLEMNVREIIAQHGGAVVQRGVTGGDWCNGDGLVGRCLVCDRYARNNLVMWIKQHPNVELVETPFGAYYRLRGYCIAIGAGYGGSRHYRAKQHWYAVIKLDEVSQ